PPPRAERTGTRSRRASQSGSKKSRSIRSMSPSCSQERGGILGARARRWNWTEVRKRLDGSPSRKAGLAAQRREYRLGQVVRGDRLVEQGRAARPRFGAALRGGRGAPEPRRDPAEAPAAAAGRGGPR